MKIDHGNLRALAAVVREGSFERAALALSVTPSAVSQRIKALEDRMGRLLVQRTVPAAATADGRVLVQLAEQTALLEHDALNRLGVAEDDVPHASIPIAVNHDSLETWFVEAALRFGAHPRHAGYAVRGPGPHGRAAAQRRRAGRGDHAGRSGAGLPHPCAGQHALRGDLLAGLSQALFRRA